MDAVDALRVLRARRPAARAGVRATATKRALVERFAASASSASRPPPTPIPGRAAVRRCSDLLRSLPRKPGVHYKATCANLRAVERALADLDAGFGANEISLLVSATEAIPRKTSTAPAATNGRTSRDGARREGPLPADRQVSVAFGCPLKARSIPPRSRGRRAIPFPRCRARRPRHTIGAATPSSVRDLFKKLKGGTRSPTSRHARHGAGELRGGVRSGRAALRCSFGGVGGHPAKVKYGGGFTGNVCTEDLVNLFESMGIATGIDLDGLLTTAEFCERALGRELHAA